MKLRFSLRQFLAIVTAWCIAFAVSPFLQVQNDRSNPRFLDAAIHVKYLRLRASLTEEESPGISRTRLLQDPLISELLSVPDSWGNGYHLTTRLPKDGETLEFHFYSTGRDGISVSDGDDPDDINSWREHELYRSEIRRAAYLWRSLRTLWLTPLICFGMLLAGRFVRRTYPLNEWALRLEWLVFGGPLSSDE